MKDEDGHSTGQADDCGCFSTPSQSLTVTKELGMDDHFAEVSLLTCPVCGQHWLRVFYEIEAFTASGRWYLGAINKEQATLLSTENAKNILESLDCFFYGGSYFGGKSGKSSGKIFLD